MKNVTWLLKVLNLTVLISSFLLITLAWSTERKLDKSTAENFSPLEEKIKAVISSTLGENFDWNVIASASGSSNLGPSLKLGSTVGQIGVGQSSLGGLNLISGFWQNFTPMTTCCGFYVGGYTGNTNCDIEGLRDLADIVQLVDRVYLTKMLLCCEKNGNVNGDLQDLKDLSDIVRLIDHVYLTKVETAICM